MMMIGIFKYVVTAFTLLLFSIHQGKLLC
jgi:hypothetical protein